MRLTTTTRPSSLHADPIRFNELLDSDHGVLDYDFAMPEDPAQAQVDLTQDVPSNLHAISEALARSRDDLPDINDWRDYCRYAWNVSKAGQEDGVGPLLARAFGPNIARDDSRSFQKASLVDVGHLLPLDQSSLQPDQLGGIFPTKLKTQLWLKPVLSRFFPKSNMICANEVHEFKSSAGSLVKAVSPAQLHASGLVSENRLAIG